MRSDLQLQVSLRKLACVLDPALLLSHATGPLLAERLTQVLEPWLTRSFWQALDSSELLASHDSDGKVSGAALAQWLALRERTEPGAWLLRWIGDCMAESRLHDEGDMRLLERWEQLAEALGEAAQHGAWCRGFDATTAARDTLALSAALDGALVLCESEPAGKLDPHPVAAASAAGLVMQRLDPLPADSLYSAERQWLRQALALAGLAPLVDERLRLAALHVLPPRDEPSADTALWQGARVVWYHV
jgi:hypothetical protein